MVLWSSFRSSGFYVLSGESLPNNEWCRDIWCLYAGTWMTSLINKSTDWPLSIIKQQKCFPNCDENPKSMNKLMLNEPAKLSSVNNNRGLENDSRKHVSIRSTKKCKCWNDHTSFATDFSKIFIVLNHLQRCASKLKEFHITIIVHTYILWL